MDSDKVKFEFGYLPSKYRYYRYRSGEERYTMALFKSLYFYK